MAEQDLARLIVSIEATQVRFEKQMASIARAAAKSAKGIEDDFARANNRVAGSFDQSGRRAVQSLGMQRAAVQNLSFQLNDISMQLASGTSPFTVMIQQGSQVAQIMQGAGGLTGAVRLLGGAFASLVNPVSLASYAIIGLGGAAIHYFTTLKSEVPDANEILKVHAQIIESFDAAYGTAEQSAKRYTDAAKRIELAKLADQFGTLKNAATSAADILGREVADSIDAIKLGDAASEADAFGNALSLLNRDVPDFRGFADAMISIEKSQAPLEIRELATALREAAQQSISTQEAIEGMQRRLDNVKVSGEAAKKAFEALTSAALGLGEPGAKAIGMVADKITTALIPATERAIKQLIEYIGHFSTLQQQINQTKLGTLPPLVSGGGQFLNPQEMQDLRANEAQYREAGESAAAAMIRGFEGFIAHAKWDVNAFRVGFGSDTTTRANGMIEKVTRDTVVTLADAERDLSRRIIEFQSGIQKAIGIDTWNSLSEAQQAALSSIAYNYGSLPDSIVAAIQSGGGPEKVAKAIAALSANPDRRREEAQAYLSGTGISMKEAGLGGRNRSDIFQGSIEQVQKRIEVMNAEYEAQARLNPLINDYGFAQEKARIEAQLLAEAQQAGLPITDELKAKISELAANYAKASAATEKLGEKQKQTQETSKFLNQTLAQAFADMIPAIETGNAALDRLLNTLIEAVAQAALLGTGPLASLFGGFGGGGLLSIFGFASGTPNTGGRRGQPRGIVHGQEAVIPLPGNGKVPVDIRLPSMSVPSVPGRGGQGGGQSITINAPINATNSDAAGLDRLRQEVRQLGKNIPKMVVQTTKNTQLRNVRA